MTTDIFFCSSSFFSPGGPGAAGTRETTKGVETGAWRQAPCLLPPRFGFFVFNLTFLSLNTSLPSPHQPDPGAPAPTSLALLQTGWREDVEPSRSKEYFRQLAISFQETFR